MNDEKSREELVDHWSVGKHDKERTCDHDDSSQSSYHRLLLSNANCDSSEGIVTYVMLRGGSVDGLEAAPLDPMTCAGAHLR